MRLFVAFEVSAGVRAEIARRVEAIRPELPNGRWVPEANLHLTLCFLGSVGSEHVVGLRRSLVPAFLGSRPLDLRVEGCGMFPERGRARAGWLGIRSRGGLGAVQQRVSSAALLAARTAGQAPKILDSISSASLLLPPRTSRVARPKSDGLLGRDYHPHVTVVRAKSGWSSETRRRFEIGFEGFEGEWKVDSGLLMESRLGSEGAIHRILEEFALRP